MHEVALPRGKLPYQPTVAAPLQHYQATGNARDVDQMVDKSLLAGGPHGWY